MKIVQKRKSSNAALKDNSSQKISPCKSMDKDVKDMLKFRTTEFQSSVTKSVVGDESSEELESIELITSSDCSSVSSNTSSSGKKGSRSQKK